MLTSLQKFGRMFIRDDDLVKDCIHDVFLHLLELDADISSIFITSSREIIMKYVK